MARLQGISRQKQRVHGQSLAYCHYMAYMDDMANDRTFQMRTTDEFLRRIDDWRRLQEDLPSRAEAMRRLVELGMDAPSHREAAE